jgi:hypothetical protein
MYRRRQLMRRIANGELPPQWDGLAWDDFVDRQREENNDVGPTPELYDAYIALDTLGAGVWSTFMVSTLYVVEHDDLIALTHITACDGQGVS